MQLFRTTLLGGILLLIPLVFASLILGKAYQYSMIVAGPIGEFFGTETVLGTLAVNVMAVILILALCFVGGLIAQMSFIRKHVDRVDAILIELIPGYSIAKSMVAGVVDPTTAMGALKPVLAEFDDNSQIAFEVDRNGDTVVLFLPGAPGAWSGTSIAMDASRVTPLDLPTHQVSGLLRVLGRGSASIIAKARAGQPEATLRSKAPQSSPEPPLQG